MIWTNKEPKQCIDPRKQVALIKRLAGEAKETVDHSDYKRFVEPVEVVLADLVKLAPAAAVVRGDKVESAEEVQEWLFEEDAIEFIKAKCRTRYFLWYLLERLETETYPINVLALARAHARAKDALQTKHYGFNWVRPAELIYSLKGMPPGFVFRLWESGLVIAYNNPNFDGFGIIINPLLLDD